MNQPTVEQYLGTPYDDEDDLKPEPDRFLEKIAEGVQQLVEHFTTGEAFTAELAVAEPEPVDRKLSRADLDLAHLSELYANTQEALADSEEKNQTLTEVLTAVDEALGKSKAAPALAARAVIEAWRNPQVPDEPVVGPVEEDTPESVVTPLVSEETIAAVKALEDKRAADDGPLPPAHNAPVEEWRAYARSLGYAGPEIETANRSQIRTALGLSQAASE